MPLAAVIMAAGLGTRMKSATPKHLHPLLGRRLVDWIVEAVRPDGSVQTIEGNSSDRVSRRVHPQGSALGYVRMS